MYCTIGCLVLFLNLRIVFCGTGHTKLRDPITRVSAVSPSVLASANEEEIRSEGGPTTETMS